MLQRKQSIWLLIAALLNACVVFFDLYRWEETVNGVVTKSEIRVTNIFPLLLLVVVIAALPLVAIFMFGNRKRQKSLTIISIVGACSFVAMMLAKVGSMSKLTPAFASGTYWVGSVLPVVSILFLVLAIMGIRRDEKLVESMDRLR